MGSVLVAVSVHPGPGHPTLVQSKSTQQLSPVCLDPPAQLRSNLYVGSKASEEDLAALQAVGITHIVQAGVELAPSHPRKQFQYLQLVCTDTESQDIIEVFQEAFNFIDNGREEGVVLVHCAQGVSRSASVLIGYLMAREQLSYEAALAELQAVRPQVQPNTGFALQLQEFGRCGCSLDKWTRWDQARMDDCFAQVSVSRRREVSGLAAMIRHFHMADVGEEDTVIDCRSFLL